MKELEGVQEEEKGGGGKEEGGGGEGGWGKNISSVTHPTPC